MLLVRFPLRYRRAFAWKIIKAVAIWPVAGQDFQNTKRPAVQYFFKIILKNLRMLARSNDHTLI